ncbi:hypothetical protein HHI36_023493 [Cryptolaemus montrouzieri]|uniref:Poly [ADP-ribose] polymerase n=1 Tax=Cryptolaemus montrouzieri TaxID=559131 RepID=A0ABD2PGK3_9CUCU
MKNINMLETEGNIDGVGNIQVRRDSNSVQVVTNAIETNFKGCDMVLTLFIAALNSYRSDHCLRPFPSNFIKDNVKDISRLRNLCDKIPPLEEFLAQPLICSDEMLLLLSWLFVEKSFPSLELLPFSSNILPNNIPDFYKPQFVFEVHYHPKIEELFKFRKGDKDVILAYHGSHIDNFYSILKVGLQQHFSLEKETLFGKGIYLSSECSVSGHYSPFGQTWKNSSLGNKHSIIAICEIINDIHKVKCKDSDNRNRSINENSTAEVRRNTL